MQTLILNLNSASSFLLINFLSNQTKHRITETHKRWRELTNCKVVLLTYSSGGHEFFLQWNKLLVTISIPSLSASRTNATKSYVQTPFSFKANINQTALLLSNNNQPKSVHQNPSNFAIKTIFSLTHSQWPVWRRDQDPLHRISDIEPDFSRACHQKS